MPEATRTGAASAARFGGLNRRARGSTRFAACVAVVVAALAAAGSCASGGRQTGAGASAGAGKEVTIAVENVASPSVNFSVQLVSSTGERSLLGAVGPQLTERFELADVSFGVSYRLVAESVGGTNIVSQRFTLKEGSRVRWRLPFNELRVSP